MKERPPKSTGFAIYPGSFDPPTNGHLDVIVRAAAVFSRLLVAVVVNPQKHEPMFTIDEREAMIRECVADLANVTVQNFRGLLADFVRSQQVDVIVKGLRVVSDFESEMATAHMNRKLSSVDTMFLMANTEYSFVSSSMVKEAFLLGGDVREFVPSSVWERLERKRPSISRSPGPTV